MWVVYVPRGDATLKQIAEAWIPVRETKGVAKKDGADLSTHSATDRRYRVLVVQHPDAIPEASSLTNLDVVYVMGGHCTSGSENVTWPDNNQNPIKYDVVADRLVSAGLRSDFAGKIKIYSCQSGVGGDQSFGKRFADYMRGDKGFGCDVYAYSGNISTDYINTQPGNDAPTKEKRKAMGVIADLREEGGIHKFMQLVVGRPYTKRARDSKDLV
jgi:hypothetical protein